MFVWFFFLHQVLTYIKRVRESEREWGRRETETEKREKHTHTHTHREKERERERERVARTNKRK